MEIVSFQDLGLHMLIKGEWQAHLDKYLKLMLVEMVGWYPGLRKMQKMQLD